MSEQDKPYEPKEVTEEEEATVPTFEVQVPHYPDVSDASFEIDPGKTEPEPEGEEAEVQPETGDEHTHYFEIGFTDGSLGRHEPVDFKDREDPKVPAFAGQVFKRTYDLVHRFMHPEDALGIAEDAAHTYLEHIGATRPLPEGDIPPRSMTLANVEQIGKAVADAIRTGNERPMGHHKQSGDSPQVAALKREAQTKPYTGHKQS